MVGKIRIQGVPPYDGEHDLGDQMFTYEELHQVKQLSGLRLGEFDDALSATDTDLILSLAVIALQRNGHETVDVSLLWSSEGGAIALVVDAVPPPESPQRNEENELPPNASSNDSAESSGDGTSLASGSLENGQQATGTPDLDTSVTSPPVTLVP